MTAKLFSELSETYDCILYTHAGLSVPKAMQEAAEKGDYKVYLDEAAKAGALPKCVSTSFPLRMSNLWSVPFVVLTSLRTGAITNARGGVQRAAKPSQCAQCHK